MPDPTKRGSSTSSVVPGYVVDSSTTSCPGRRMRATSAAAATMCVMSGSLDLESGVGTQITMTSASPSASADPPTIRRLS